MRPQPERVEKLMSLTLTEFQYTIRTLAGRTLRSDETHVLIPIGEGVVTIRYEPRATVRFGGLLDLPRALVTLTFDAMTPDETSAFVTAFDRTFQRGGG